MRLVFSCMGQWLDTHRSLTVRIFTASTDLISDLTPRAVQPAAESASSSVETSGKTELVVVTIKMVGRSTTVWISPGSTGSDHRASTRTFGVPSPARSNHIFFFSCWMNENKKGKRDDPNTIWNQHDIFSKTKGSIQKVTLAFSFCCCGL